MRREKLALIAAAAAVLAMPANVMASGSIPAQWTTIM